MEVSVWLEAKLPQELSDSLGEVLAFSSHFME